MALATIDDTTFGDDPVADAAAAGLHHVTDDRPGYHRRRRGRGFSYVDEDGVAIRDPRVLERIRALVIPPAWTDVWICRDPNGHLQATGRDDRGRKQYLYHPRWRSIRDANKFDRLAEFGLALGPLRAEVDGILRRRGPAPDVVLAAVVRLLDVSLVRVGNEAYAQDNETFGLTTLRPEHVEVEGGQTALRFVGKHGTEFDVPLDDPRLERIVKRCHELGGKTLFSYRDQDGQLVCITSSEVNDHLRDLTGGLRFSAKDFRTWGGTVVAAEVLASLGTPETAKQADADALVAIDTAAERLGNTRTVARNCYVHPDVVAAHGDGRLEKAWASSRTSRWYSRAERATLHLLTGDV